MQRDGNLLDGSVAVAADEQDVEALFHNQTGTYAVCLGMVQDAGGDGRPAGGGWRRSKTGCRS
jgi:hypothetical protein